MATWPSIGARAAPIDNTAGAPTTGTPTPSPRPVPSPETESIETEVTFDPQSQSNPYFLHPNENPALVLVSVPLDGLNYHPWARAMTMALSCKNKIKFVNGSITKPPEDDPKFDVWSRCNDMVMSWIVRSLSPMVGQSVLWIDTAYGVWNDLKRRFSQQDLFRIAQIKCEIYQTKQGDNSLNEYFTHQKLLWDELQILRPTVGVWLLDSAKMVENQFGAHVKSIRLDNGLEFSMSDYFSQQGILHQTSCTYTPQQNSRVERKHDHLLSIARALRFQAHLPERFWGECILHATYIINRLPSVAINQQIPYQVLLKKVPQYQHLKVFGCLAYAATLGPKSKFDARAKKCIFLGYGNGTKGYKLYDLCSKVVFLSKDVVFYENTFPFQQNASPERDFTQMILPADISADLSDDQQGQHHTISPEQPQSPPLGEMFDHVPEQSQSPSLGEVPEHTSPPEAPQQPVVRRTINTSQQQA
nr:uncharacterized protein LOC109150247 [Ipomoea batatas]